MISAETDSGFMAHDESRSRAAQGGAFATLFDWVQSYPMNTHADLGRAGVVCPFTRQARRFDTMRLGLCEAGPDEEESAFTIIRRGFEELNRIPANRGMEQFRTVVIAFPGCDSEAGIAMLQRAQRRHRFYALLRFRMMGFMHPRSESPGLWNPDFRPLRAPMPVLAIRYLVEQDVAFIHNQHLQWGPYLVRYRLVGAKRLFTYRRAQ
jgi:hypothetical protein